MMDISVRRDAKDKAFVYLDGPDARLFNALEYRLGSDDLAQNAIILEGLISKWRAAGNKAQITRTQKIFPKIVGVTYSEVQRIVSSMLS